MVHWQDEPWIRLRDMPCLLPRRDEVGGGVAGGNAYSAGCFDPVEAVLSCDQRGAMRERIYPLKRR